MAGRPLRRARMNPDFTSADIYGLLNPSGLDRKHDRPYYGAKPQMTRRAAVREQVEEMGGASRSSLPAMEDLKQKRKVVIGPEGFSSPTLTPLGKKAFKEISGTDYDDWSTPRHHPALVWMAENAPGYFHNYSFGPGFRVVDVPGGVYEIREYDGYESVHTPDSIKWVRI